MAKRTKKADTPPEAQQEGAIPEGTPAESEVRTQADPGPAEAPPTRWVQTIQANAKAAYRFDKQADLVLIKFAEKPEPEVREALQRNGFKWQPVKQAWGRKDGPTARHLAEKLFREFAPAGDRSPD